MRLTILIATLLGASLPVAAFATVIAGPSLTSPDVNYAVSGLEFTAARNVDLTAFTFQNQGAADNIELTDTSGVVLDSVATAAGVDSAVTDVTWSLTAGQSYWLLQTTADNAFYGSVASLPSDSDISIVVPSSFAQSVSGVLACNPSNSVGCFASDSYWADFNDITTGSGAPEPSAWFLMLAGLGAAGAALRRRRVDPRIADA